MYTLLNFSAQWCEPCKWAEPVIHQVVEHFGEKIMQRKIDIDAEPDFTKQFHVMSVPSFVLLKNDEEIWRMNGFDLAANMIRDLEPLIS